MKQFILDTNVIVHDAASLTEFGDNIVIVPIQVLKELDEFKKHPGELGCHARKAVRMLDDLRSTGSLAEGVKINEDGGCLRVIDCPIHKSVDGRSVDDRLLAAALVLTKDFETILVTKDINLRVRADAYRIKAVDYEKDKLDFIEYPGSRVVQASRDEITVMREDGAMEVCESGIPNQFASFVDLVGKNVSILGRFSDENTVKPINGRPHAVNIKPRNKEQTFAMNMLLDPEIEICTIIGKAGTGKSILAISCAIEQVFKSEVYSKIIIIRPTITVGRDLGYLPGDIDEKMDPWMKPIKDTVSSIMVMNSKGGKKASMPVTFKMEDYIENVPIAYIRGRNFDGSFIIVDEAQNTNLHEIKTIITRCGEHSKIVLIGDIDQIDNGFVDKRNCGMSQVLNKFHGDPIYAHVKLEHSERSRLAEKAATLL